MAFEVDEIERRIDPAGRPHACVLQAAVNRVRGDNWK